MIKIEPKIYDAKVSEIKMQNNWYIKVVFDLISPNSIDFVPGQFINLKVAQNTYRTYSICSMPKIKDKVKIVATINFEGIGANYLKGLKVGDRISFIGASGRFRLFENSLKNVLFVCTGTGISPYIPMLNQLLDLNNSSDIRLYFGCRTEDETLFGSELDRLKLKYSNFDYEICLSKPSDNWTGNKGYVTKYININDPKNTQVYICGLDQMIDNVVELCKNKGISEEDIAFEKF